jgi:signal peptidase I
MSDRPSIDLRTGADLERMLAAQTARAQVEAQRILHSALEQAATLQAEMSQEVEAQTRRRIEKAEHEVAERLASADREAEERVRQSVDTAASLLLNAHREADRIRAQLSEAMRAQTEALRAELISTPRPSVAPPEPTARELAAQREAAERDAAEREAAARLAEAESLAAERIAEAEAWSQRHLAEVDELGTQRIIDAEQLAQDIIERARVAAAEITTAPLEDTRPPPPIEREADRQDAVEPPAAAEPRPSVPLRVHLTRAAVVILAVVIGVFVVRAFVVEPYSVSSTSMEPTFQDGDRLVVNKLAYRFGELERGDIVVIDSGRVPGATAEDGESVVKRVIGLPGEVVRATGGQVIVNDEQMDEPWLGDVPTADFGPVTVPDDAVFVLGDARLKSIDSREFGPVPTDAVVGRVEAVIWPPGDIGGV